MISNDIATAAATLASAGVASPLYDAQLIAAHFLGCVRTELFLHNDAPTPAAFHEAVARRANREPLQHILGTAPMGPLELAVGPGVFVPRPETELLAQWGVDVMVGVDKPVAVDLCTGSGAIAAYLAYARPDAQVTAVELDETATRWAAQNFAALTPNVQLLRADATDIAALPTLHGQCDLVLSNPPYVPETAEVTPEVTRDPHQAVFGGADGMSVINPMLKVVAGLLKPGGWVGIEHDDTTADLVVAAMNDQGCFGEIVSRTDLAGRDRFVTARKL